MNKYKPILEGVKWIWVIVVVGFSGYYLSLRWEQVATYFSAIPAGNILLAMVFLLFSKTVLVLFTKFSVDREGITLTYLDTFSVVAFTQLAKYLPGGVWHFLGRLGAYSRQNMSMKRSIRAIVIETAWLLSGALMTGAFAGVLSPYGRQFLGRYGIQISWVILEAVILLLWFLLLVGFEHLFQAEKLIPHIKIFSLQWISWVCLGISFAYILPKHSFASLSFYISIYSFSWLIGYVIFFAPGGIGVRELAIVLMLSGYMSSEDVVIYSAVHRFLFIVVEILLGGFAGVIVFFLAPMFKDRKRKDELLQP